MRKNRLFNRAKVKEAGGAPSPVVIQNLDVRPVHRTDQDAPKWKAAIQSAEATTPRRNLLYNLYFETVLDDQVEAVWGKRTDAITTANWQFVDKEGKPIDTINELIDSIGFDEILEEIMNTKAWGYSMFEPKFFKNSSDKWEVAANLVPRLHMRPELGVIAYDTIGNDGINIRAGIYPKTIMEVGKTTDLGVLVKASIYAILKRGGTGDYAMFVQVFGSPVIDATWDGFDPNQRVQLLQAIDEMGSGGKLVRPEGTTVQFLENKTAGQEPHSKFLERMDKAISKCLLGTTETTESSSGSGFAQSKTHQDQDNVKHNADLAYVRRTLNSRFIKILEAHGFDTHGGSFVIQGEETELTKKESFEIVIGLKEKFNLPIDDDFLYETYGIPKPKNYEALKKETADQQTQDKKLKNTKSSQKKTSEPTENPDNKKTKDQEKDVELSWYKKVFTSVFPTAPTVTLGANKTTCCGNHHTVKLAASEGLDATDFIKRIYDAKGELTFDFEIFEYTTNLLLKGFKKGFKKELVQLSHNIGFQYEIDDPALLTAFEQNLFRFAGTKSLALTAELNELFRDTKSFDAFYRLALEKTEVYNKTWLETEYNTALLTGEAAATYHRLIKQAEVFPYWEYKVVGDDQVRPEHKLLGGLILPATDPRWKKLFPPNGWNCRCYIVPRLPHEFDKLQLNKMRERADEYLNSTQFEKEVAQGWGVNRALSAEVFTANQMYIYKHPNVSFTKINELRASHYNLPSYSNAKKAATENYPVYTDTADDFYSGLETLVNNSIVRDLLKRPIHISPKAFKLHVHKKDNRVQLLKAMENTLLEPDEIWLRGKDLNEKVYIKYYKNKTLIVLTGENHLQLELRTWFPLTEKKKEINNWRKGLLLMRKK